MASDSDALVARIVALAGDIANVNHAVDNWPNVPLTSGQLVAIIVEDGDESSYSAGNTERVYFEARTFTLNVVVQPETMARTDLDVPGRQAARDWQKTVVDHFFGLSRLQRGDSGLAGVTGAAPLTSSVGIVQHSAENFWGVLIPLQVTIRHNI